MAIDTPAGIDSEEGMDLGAQHGDPDDPRRIWRPSTAGYVGRFFVLGLFAAFVLTAPFWVPDTQTNILSRAAVFAMVALSMNVLMGYTGQVSLGHAAFVGVGAFSAGFALTEAQMPWMFAAVFAIATGGVSALILGGIALRVRGLYLALVTIAYGLFAQEVIFNIRAVTRGGAGMPAPRPAFASGDYAYFYLCVAAVLVVWVLDWLLTSSKAGRAIQALRDDERVAASWGINVTGFKLLAFVVSGSIAGLAGALFASIETIVVSISFGFGLSLLFVLMTVVGGLGSRPGVVTGGVLFAVLPTLLETAHNAWSWWPFTALWEPLIGALLLILTLIFFPGGIAQQNEHLYRWLSFKKFHAEEHGPVANPGGGGGH
ncbi:MAG: branched-chain amino acid ABC transporter permease [Actinobacteria bacterium]|nr:branched-chain amino acid ABC transporter permease [Actinomycetota bacterium]